MNRLSFYSLLILLYLGFSGVFIPEEQGIIYIKDSTSFSEYFKDAPISIILTNMHSVGLVLKTHYHKYLVVHGFKPAEQIIVKVSRNFYSTCIPYLGLSLFQRGQDGVKNYTPSPPGTLFVGNAAFGSWVPSSSGEEKWMFHRPYRHFYTYFGWGNFRPTYAFFEKAERYQKQKSVFLGFNNEFGLEGQITKTFFPSYYQREATQNILSFKKYLKRYFRSNFPIGYEHE